MIRRKILTQEVRITGINFPGRESTIVFTPRRTPGWYLRAFDKKNNQMHRIPINYRIAICKTGRISIAKYDSEIPCWEHIGPLRYLGIDNIEVHMEKGNCSWPPYFTTKQYYEKLSPYLKETNEEIGFTQNLYNVNKSHSKKKEVFVKIDKARDCSLTIRAGWPGSNEKEKKFLINSDFEKILLEEIFPARPQGYPHYRYYFARLAEIFGWKNVNSISWLKNSESIEKMSEEWFNHRVLDMLGAMSLKSHCFLLSANVVSHFAGHKLDLAAIKDAC